MMTLLPQRCRYSMGLREPREILIRFSFYQHVAIDVRYATDAFLGVSIPVRTGVGLVDHVHAAAKFDAADQLHQDTFDNLRRL